MDMLLNIVDFDPRPKKDPKHLPDKSKGNNTSGPSSKKLSILKPDVKKSQKTMQLNAAAVKPAKPGLGKRPKLAAPSSAVQLTLAPNAVVEAPVPAKKPRNNLTFESVPNKPVQPKSKRSGLQSSVSAQNEDWASSIQDCLLEEVKDPEKLFHEKLDMESRTDATEAVFSKCAIKDCKDIHPYLVSLLTDKLGLEYFTKVQADTLPLVLAGNDVLIKTQTGSGKSLALLLPLVQQLQSVQPPLCRSSGLQALVLCPTHELADQTQRLLQQLLRPFVRIVSGQLVGGVRRKSQKAALRRGLNIAVATPHRLLDHLERTRCLGLGQGLRMLVIDEADRLAELGFERDVRRIVEAVCSGGRRPQTLLCSATLTDGVERLAGLAMQSPSRVFEDAALPTSVRHFLLAAPTKLGLRAALASVRGLLAAGHRVAFFLPTQAAVNFYHALFSALLGDSVPLCRLHGNLSHSERAAAFREFATAAATGSSSSGLLVTTDVSARGLDLSCLGWVLQGPGDPATFCHRAGRTARLGRPGRSLLLLDTGEAAGFLRLLVDSPGGPARGALFAPLALRPLLTALCPDRFFADTVARLLEDGDSDLRQLAEDAFVSCVRARASFAAGGALRAALPQPHLGHLAAAFCLRDTPGAIAGSARRRRAAAAGDSPASRAAATSSRVIAGRRVRRHARADRMSEFASGL